MKKRIREIAHTGTFRTKNGQVTITRKMLADIVETFGTMNSAPITLGHEVKPTSPRFGSVKAVRLSGEDSLIGEVEEQDAMYDAVNAGFFPECSIGSAQNADGKYYLHHLAYLGEEPPAIKDLKNNIAETVGIAANDAETFIFFPTIKLSDEGENNMDELEKAKQRIAELEAELAEAKKAGDNPDDNALKQENEALKKQLADLQARLDKAKSEHPEIELSDADATTRMLYAELQASKKTALRKAAEGKIPKQALDRLVALSDSLSVSKSITLSDSKEKASVIDVLTGVFEALPDNKFLQNELTLSDAQSSDKEKPVDYAALLASM